METPKIVTAEEWEAARLQLLVNEKELTRARDALAAERRRGPLNGRRGQVIAQLIAPAGRPLGA